jgi:hypothetical protein
MELLIVFIECEYARSGESTSLMVYIPQKLEAYVHNV